MHLAPFSNMNHVLGEILNCAAYLDVKVYSDTWEQHLQLLEPVFTCLSDASLVLNLDKCDYGKGVLSYLGKIVGQSMVKFLDAKIQAICAVPAPKTRQDLCHFLCMVGYYRCLCMSFSDVILPQTNLCYNP